MSRAHSPARTLTPHSGGDGLAREVAALCPLDAKAPRELWVTLCGAPPPHGLSRPLLTRALAYRIQERALGGLKPGIRRLLLRFADDDVVSR